MGQKTVLSGNTLTVQGSDKVDVPEEVLDFFQGKGISMEFLKTHYGLGAKGISIAPTQRDLKGQMLGPG